METRSINPLALTSTEWITEVVSLIALVSSAVLIVIHFAELPEQIPSHYNLYGVPDQFSEKSSIWLLPAITAGVYAVMTVITLFRLKLNYPFAITPVNEERQYRNATLMIRTLKCIIVSNSFFLCWATLQVGIGQSNGLGYSYGIAFVVTIFVTIGLFMYRAFRLR